MFIYNKVTPFSEICPLDSVNNTQHCEVRGEAGDLSEEDAAAGVLSEAVNVTEQWRRAVRAVRGLTTLKSLHLLTRNILKQKSSQVLEKEHFYLKYDCGTQSSVLIIFNF